MNSLADFLSQHQIIATAILTWIANSGFTMFATSLPSPTAQSTAWYQFWFKFLNRLAANLSRANNSSVESSPNFQAAVTKQTDLAGVAPIAVQSVDVNRP